MQLQSRIEYELDGRVGSEDRLANLTVPHWTFLHSYGE